MYFPQDPFKFKGGKKGKKKDELGKYAAYQVQPTCFLPSANGTYVTLTSVR